MQSFTCSDAQLNSDCSVVTNIEFAYGPTSGCYAKHASTRPRTAKWSPFHTSELMRQHCVGTTAFLGLYCFSELSSVWWLVGCSSIRKPPALVVVVDWLYEPFIRQHVVSCVTPDVTMQGVA